MQQTAITDLAHELLAQFGSRALIITAQQQRGAESKGDQAQLATWRRIESKIKELRAAVAG